MIEQVLRDKDVFPSVEVLEKALKESYSVYNQFINTIINNPYFVQIEWRYYNDGKSWLCKITCKKKTICWLSVWDGFFKVSFYFTEKYKSEICNLDIETTIKDTFKKANPIGRLIPIIFVINPTSSLHDLLQVIEYKIKIK